MSERLPQDGAQPSGELPEEVLDAYLAAAYEAEPGALPGVAGSVLGSLAGSMHSAPRVHLRDAAGESVTPVFRLEPSAKVPAGGSAVLGDVGRYQVFGEIARGGMGIILKGRDSDLGREVAMKVIRKSHRKRPELLERFVEEAQIAGQLQHPGIVPVYELGQLRDGRPYFTMKLVKGRTLAALLEARKDLEAERARFLGIFQQVSQTMAYAHARGVIHRDLKPANIMVGAFGEVQIMDWGLAKVLAEGGIADEEKARRSREAQSVRTVRSEGKMGTQGSPTRAGSVLGTPAYMAPEQARGDMEAVDERADVFGLGAILCEILTGEPPYTGTAEEAQRKAQAGSLEEASGRLEASGTDRELLALVRRCLEAEPKERPQDAGEVAGEVAAYLQSVEKRLRAAELLSVEARAKAEEERKRRKLAVALAAVVVLSVVGGGGGWLAVKNERAEAAKRVSFQVNEAVTSATALKERAKAAGPEETQLWARARAEAERAAAFLESHPADPELEARVERLRAELDEEEKDRNFLLALDAAWVAMAEPDPAKNRFGMENVVPPIREAFRAYGITPGEGDAKGAAARLRGRPKAVLDLAAASLDEWIRFAKRYKIDEPHLSWLEEVARTADLDPWRQALREIGSEADEKERRAALEELASDEPELSRQPVRTLTRLCFHLGEIGSTEPALKVLLRAKDLYPGDFWVNMALGQAFLRSEPGEAVRYYTALVALRPESGPARTNLGVALLDQNRPDEAIAAFEKALELKPGDAYAYHNLGIALRRQGKLEQAVAAHKKAVEARPDHPVILLMLGNALSDQGLLGEAAAAFQGAIDLDPDYVDAYFNLGNILKDQREHERAIAAYAKAIELEPNHVGAQNNLGAVLEDKGELGEAAAAYRKAVELAPDDARIHLNLGIVLRKDGKLDEAIAPLEKAVELKPELAQAHGNLGLVLNRQGMFEEAIAAFQRAIELGIDDAEVHGQLGLALSARGRHEEAVTAFRKAIQIRPDLAGAHYDLGMALKDQGKLDEAVAALERAIELDPKDADAHASLGNALTRQGKRVEAVAAYRRALAIEPDDARARCGLGLALGQEGAFREALAELERGHELGSRLPRWGQPSADWVKKAKRRVELDDSLEAILKGDRRPAGIQELLELAEVARLKREPALLGRLYPLCARICEETFAADPELADDLKASYRYDAACFAALAGSAGEGDSRPEERARWRKKALDWLAADLEARRTALEAGTTEARARQKRMLEHWKRDPDLAAIRDAKALSKLPAAERRSFQKLWADVEALLARVAGAVEAKEVDAKR